MTQVRALTRAITQVRALIQAQIRAITLAMTQAQTLVVD